MAQASLTLSVWALLDLGPGNPHLICLAYKPARPSTALPKLGLEGGQLPQVQLYVIIDMITLLSLSQLMLVRRYGAHWTLSMPVLLADPDVGRLPVASARVNHPVPTGGFLPGEVVPPQPIRLPSFRGGPAAA